MSKFITYTSLLLVGGIIGFFIAKSTGQSSANAADNSKVVSAKEEPKSSGNEAKKLVEQPTTTDPDPIAENNSSETEKPAEEIQEQGSASTSPNAVLPVTDDCITDEKEWSKHLTLFAEKLEKDSIMYSQTPASALSDCSGIFYRIAQFVNTTCGSYQYPDHKKNRDSRSLAKWYHDQNNLVLIQDAKKSRNLIKPGSVMFFGRSGERYSNVTIEKIAGTPQVRGVITHVGVVTEVKRDDAGDVIGYVMMHGRRKGVTAQRSHYHKIDPPRLGYPVLGNWNQQWVAVANIMTPQGAPTPVIAQTTPTPEVEATSAPSSPAETSTATAVSQNATPSTLPAMPRCVSEESAWSKQLTGFAEGLERKKLAYTQSPPELLQDCSGIFFRMTQFAASQCNKYQYPDPKKTRDTRSLAKWYYDNKNLVIVEDAKKSRNLIKPGSVMFFGRSGERYSHITIERIAGTPQKRGAITHMGVVTEVTRDDAGNVIGYVMMHGRRPGVTAQRTHYHKIDPPRLGYPVLGNWNQQWVAVANIMTPSGSPASQELASR